MLKKSFIRYILDRFDLQSFSYRLTTFTTFGWPNRYGTFYYWQILYPACCTQSLGKFITATLQNINFSPCWRVVEQIEHELENLIKISFSRFNACFKSTMHYVQTTATNFKQWGMFLGFSRCIEHGENTPIYFWALHRKHYHLLRVRTQ